MSFVDWLAQPACRMLTLTLLHFLWQGLIVVLVLISLVKLGVVVRPATRYASSLAALVAMAAFPVMTLAYLSRGYEYSPSALLPDPANSPKTNSDIGQLIDASQFPIDPASLEAFQPYLLALWLGGVLFFCSRLLAGAIGVEKLRRSRLQIPPALAARIERLGERFQMDTAGLVFLSQHVSEAMALGLLRKFVLVPAAWATEMPLDMLEAVIAHELAHLRRMDLWANFLQRILETLFFYHPAVWWLSRRLRIERELCADELAVAVTGDRLVYAQTLEHVANWRRADVRPALAAFLRGESNMRLLQRIRNILAPSPDERRHWPAGLAALALTAVLWTLSLTLLDPLSTSAYAAKDPAQDDETSGEQDQSGDQDQSKAQKPSDEKNAPGDSALELDVDIPTSEIIERKVAEAVKRALAQADKIKQKKLDKASRKVDEDLKKVRLYHIQLEKEAKDKAVAARRKADALLAGEADAPAKKVRTQVEFHSDGDDLTPADKEKLKIARYRLIHRDPEAALVLQQDSDKRIDELTALVKKLTVQVERLSKQVNELRDKENGSEDRTN
jgi:beta-lactamase regulating signal transducer with metallopeptidase domain